MPLTIRFTGELNDFVPKMRREVFFEVEFVQPRAVKDLIESLGVPHVEVDAIIVNDASVDFSYRVKRDDRIEVYPFGNYLHLSRVQHLIPALQEPKSFVLDVHLRKLARVLRMMGIDVVHDARLDDDDLIELAEATKRILLTRDKGILKNGRLTRGYYIRNQDPMLQAREVITRFRMLSDMHPLTRCIECNGLIHAMVKSEAMGHVPSGVFEREDSFYECSDCHRIYWKGSHFDHMQETISSLL